MRRALSALFAGASGKYTASRVWREVKGDRDACDARSLTKEPIVRLIHNGTAVGVRLDRNGPKTAAIVIGVRAENDPLPRGLNQGRSRTGPQSQGAA